MEENLSVEGLSSEEILMLQKIVTYLLNSDQDERSAVVSLFSHMLNALGLHRHTIRRPDEPGHDEDEEE